MERDRLLLIVGPPGAARSIVEREASNEDLSVAVCPGPTPCPLLRHERCGLADLADGVMILDQPSPTLPVRVGLSRCASTVPIAEFDRGDEPYAEMVGRLASKMRHPSAG